MSDPFQPLEAKTGWSYDCLKLFAKTKYPFVFSTKGAIIGTPKYLNLLKECNVVSQISLCAPSYDSLEPNAPTFEERLEIATKLVPVSKRVIIRIQPYTPFILDTVLEYLPEYAKRGIYGIVIEGMKFLSMRKGLEKMGGDYVFNVNTLKKDFTAIRSIVHKVGLHFFCGENRLRYMGDDLCCCGCNGVEGMKVNTANLNHFLYDKQNMQFNERMNKVDSVQVFKAFSQNADNRLYFTETMQKGKSGYVFSHIPQEGKFNKMFEKAVYSTLMDKCTRTRSILKIMGK